MRIRRRSITKAKAQTAAQKFNPGSMTYTGCRLLAEFQHCHIEGQQRSDDADHNAFVQKLSKGLPIDVEDILAIKPLSKRDAKKKLKGSQEWEWKYAPVLVSTNAERLGLSRQKARLFAIDNNTYVFKWRVEVKRWVNKPGAD